MKYNFYTNYSPKVSRIGLGAWQLGNFKEWSNMTDYIALSLVNKAVEEGINFFDTAPNYAEGKSEILLGTALKKVNRGKVVISSKFGHWPDGHTDFSADKIRESVEGSLSRLRTDYLDSVLLHNPGMEIINGSSYQHYEELEKLKDEGKILAYGASLDTAEEMKTFIENTGGEVIEAFFNIIHQDARNAFKIAKRKNVGIIAKIPLDSGWLTGKYSKESTFIGIRERWSQSDIEDRAKVVEQIRDILSKEKSMPQQAIGYCLHYDAVATVIPGCVNEIQLLENIGSVTAIPGINVIRKLEKLFDNEISKMKLPW